MKTPYIGITGFCHPEETTMMLRVMENAPKPLKRRLMVVVMMSYKTLGRHSTEWASVFPANEKVADIFIQHPFLYNALHYADYENHEFEQSLYLATLYGGGALDAIQLDMKWPDATTIRVYRTKYTETELILQADKNILIEPVNGPKELVTRLEAYGSAIDYVLLDGSYGRGKAMDAENLRPFILELKKQLPDLGIAVAGGLGPKTLGLVKPLIDEFPDISLDAQGQLCPDNDCKNPVDWKRAEEYLEKALILTS